jgi:hypothetical protein
MSKNKKTSVFQEPRDQKKIIASVLIINFIVISGIFVFKINYQPPQILINQLGYHPNYQKTALIQTQTLETHGSYSIVNSNGDKVYESTSIEYLGRFWGLYYYRLNFTDFNVTGTYKIKAQLGFYRIESYIFKISPQVFNQALEYAYKFFYYQRQNCKTYELEPGYPGHEFSHADDGIVIQNGTETVYRQLYGGWFAAGDYGKFILWGNHIEGAIYALLHAYENNIAFYSQKDQYSFNGSLTQNQIPDILDEAMWGLQYTINATLPNGSIVRNLLGNLKFTAPEKNTDGIVGTEDDRKIDMRYPFAEPYEALWVAAGMIKMAQIAQTTGFYQDWKFQLYSTGLDIYTQNLQNLNLLNLNGISASALMTASLELYRYTNNVLYADLASIAANQTANWIKNQRFSKDDLNYVDRSLGLLAYWAYLNGSTMAKSIVQEAIDARFEQNWARAFSKENPFQIKYLDSFDSEGNLVNSTLLTDWLGLNGMYLYSAFAALMGKEIGYQNQSIVNYAINQIDWIFGKNPYGICMVEGLGSKNLPAYHHRLSMTKDNPRGAVPGLIPNGIIDDGKGKPYLDLTEAQSGPGIIRSISYESNEPWLIHNIAFLFMISALTNYL